jgi:hypothetical protein
MIEGILRPIFLDAYLLDKTSAYHSHSYCFPTAVARRKAGGEVLTSNLLVSPPGATKNTTTITE